MGERREGNLESLGEAKARRPLKAELYGGQVEKTRERRN